MSTAAWLPLFWTLKQHGLDSLTCRCMLYLYMSKQIDTYQQCVMSMNLCILMWQEYIFFLQKRLMSLKRRSGPLDSPWDKDELPMILDQHEISPRYFFHVVAAMRSSSVRTRASYKSFRCSQVLAVVGQLVISTNAGPRLPQLILGTDAYTSISLP